MSRLSLLLKHQVKEKKNLVHLNYRLYSASSILLPFVGTLRVTSSFEKN